MRGKLDYSQIGLFGHSRGGEGVRAALNQYRDLGSIWPSQFRNKPRFRALFELAPVDGQTNRVLDAEGVAWNVLLPTCDGDVSDLQGQRVFDRMINARAEKAPTPKSMFTVEGTNHNSTTPNGSNRIRRNATAPIPTSRWCSIPGRRARKRSA